jgi:HAMP domain-containing protein
MSIRAKLVVAIVASMVALAVATAVLVRTAGERNVRIAAEQAIAVAGQALAAAERADIEKLDATLGALAAHPGLAEAFAARDRERLLALTGPVFATLVEHGVTHLYFIEPEPRGTVFLRVHEPGLHGDVVDRATLAKAIETKGIAAGKELGMTAFALRVVRPWKGKDGRLLGYLEVAEEIDHFLGHIKRQTGDDYTLVVEKAFLDEKALASVRRGKPAGWGERGRTVVVDSTGGDPIVEVDLDLASVPDRGLLLGEIWEDGRRVVRGVVPVKDAAGRRVGGLFVAHDISALRANMLAARRGIYALLVLVAAVLAALLVALVNRLVVRRLDQMIATMEDLSVRLAGGDYDVAAPRPSSRDEIGRFEEFFGRFLQVVTGLLRELARRRG